MGNINPIVEAEYYRKEDGHYVCLLCPRNCVINVGEFGKCQSRKGGEDFLIAYNYGKVASICVDPIEKKPLYHFHPKTKIFSVGGVGCNLECRYCQNYNLSRSPIGRKRTTYESPEELVDLCRKEGMNGMAFTYNEPSIWFEYIRDIVKIAPDLEYVMITNGMISKDAMKDLCKSMSAINMDIKGFTENFYKDVCGGKLSNILASAETVFKEGVHLELTYLVIPGYNDSPEEMSEFGDWIMEKLSPDVPIHLSRFHPDHLMMDPSLTPIDTLLSLKKILNDKGLHYVYVGNIITEGGSDTCCPNCGKPVIKRTGYLVDFVGLNENVCEFCNHDLKIIR